MRKENQGNPESKKFRIPMIVSDDVIHDFGIKPEDVTWRLIEDQWHRVLLVDATEEEYRAYMDPLWMEIKQDERAGRCLVPGKNGTLIHCPEDRKCEECERYTDVCKEKNHPASLEFLAESGAEPAESGAFEDDVIYETVLEELIAMLNEINPKYGSIFSLLYDGTTQREIADTLGMNPRTVSDYVKKIRKIVQPIAREMFDR